MAGLDEAQESRLEAFAAALVDQASARVAVPAERAERGYWFGGGNMARGPDGTLYLCGRYRSAGDSRTGLDLGDRGRELAVFASGDRGSSWKKVLALAKAGLVSRGRAGAGLLSSGGAARAEGRAKVPAAARAEGAEVLSIEGAALRFRAGAVDLFVSSEKRVEYPDRVRGYRKPGTGIWSIELLTAADLRGLAGAAPTTILETDDPRYLHIKDPFLFELRGVPCLGFCHHPFTWASSSTGWVAIDPEGLPNSAPTFEAIQRGPAWDVAITRLTSVLPLPAVGDLAGLGAGLLFYDGGECLRDHGEHAAAARRPRGYSCEELGGLGYFLGGDPAPMERLSRLGPAFVSPYGTGSSRYVDVLAADEGWYASWQQSRPGGSQDLVMNFLPAEEGARILSGAGA